MPYTIQIPQEYRHLFPSLSPHETAGSQINIGTNIEANAYQFLANLLRDSLSPDLSEEARLEIVKGWQAFPTTEPVGQDVTAALESRAPSGINRPGPMGQGGVNIPTLGTGQVGGMPTVTTGGYGQVGADDPAAPNLANFVPTHKTFINPVTGELTATKHQPNTTVAANAAFDMSTLSAELMAANDSEQKRVIAEQPYMEQHRKDEINQQLYTARMSELGIGVMTAPEMGTVKEAELLTFDEVARQYRGNELLTEGANAGLINPAFAQAVWYASQQNGFISKQQVANIEAESKLELVTADNENKLAVAVQQGANAEALEKIRQDGAVELAKAQARVEESRFVVQQNLETLRHNAQMAQGSQQHEERMEQLGLQEFQLSEQYAIQNAQIVAAAEEDLRRYDLDEAESERRFDVQMQQLTDQRAVDTYGYQLASEDIDRQIKRDEIMAQAEIDVAEIQRLQAGDVAGIERQVALRMAERDEALAAIEQATIVTTGAQQLQATLAATEADIEIATAAAQSAKDTQIAIKELQNSAAIDELVKAKEIATLHANAEKDAQIAIQTLRETTILGELDKHKAIATIQQQMQITAQEATAALQANQALNYLEKEKAIAVIQQNTRASTDIAIAELQASTEITALEKTAIIEGLRSTATTQAATTQAGAVTGAAALQAEAASPFGYVGAGVDAADRAQRLTDAEAILGQQYNPYGLSNEQFTGMQNVAAQAGATPFGALSTAPEARYQDILGVQEAQAAAGPFQAAQLGQGMGDISTILRGGLTPEQQLALAQAPGNPFGFTANEAMALQNSLARGGLTPTQRLAEVQAGAAPQNMANYLNFIGNPAAVGFAGQSGFLQNIADSPEGNIPASLFGLNVPQSSPTVPTNPTMADLSGLTDEQLGFYQGQQAAQNYQTPSQIFQQAQTVTPQGV